MGKAQAQKALDIAVSRLGQNLAIEVFVEFVDQHAVIAGDMAHELGRGAKQAVGARACLQLPGQKAQRFQRVDVLQRMLRKVFDLDADVIACAEHVEAELAAAIGVGADRNGRVIVTGDADGTRHLVPNLAPQDVAHGLVAQRIEAHPEEILAVFAQIAQLTGFGITGQNAGEGLHKAGDVDRFRGAALQGLLQVVFGKLRHEMSLGL